MSLEFLINVLIKKRNFTILSNALGKDRLPMFPKTGPLWKQTPISKAILSISFGVPSKGALLPSSPHRAPTERHTPFPGPSLIHLSKSPVYALPSRFASGALMERETERERYARLQSLPLHILQGPQ
jgi:hypothetical protein